MKLTTLQENLNKGLNHVSRSVASKAQLPILGNILISTDKGRLKMVATNLEIGINLWIAAKVENEGVVSIPARVISEYVSLLPAGTVELESRDNMLSVKCANYSSEFMGLPAAEFPTVPSLSEPVSGKLELNKIEEAISQVVFAAAIDDTRPVLTGVLLKKDNEDLLMVATDGFRLSLKRLSGLGGVKISGLEKGLVLPARSLVEAVKIFGDMGGDEEIGLSVTQGANQAILASSGAEIVSRLIEGEFPDFAKILPQESQTEVVVDTEAMLRAVKTAAIFARESANIIRLKVEKDRLTVSANSEQVGKNEVIIEAKVKGAENKIAFNSRYLTDFLSSIKNEQVEFRMTSGLNPGVFLPDGDNSLTHLIMPVKVQE